MKSLICITTCNRLGEVKKYVWDYIRFCGQEKDFDFLLALDGFDQDYLDFAAEFKIPILYSNFREGVGISKNRVITYFPDYSFYFFIEDDVELLDGKIFFNHIKAFSLTKYPHFTFTQPRGILNKEKVNDFSLTHSLFGSAHFSFYEGSALRSIGGWHTLFAKYRRYGHTEHSYRFFHTGLQPAPFIVIDEEEQNLIFHYPPHVTKPHLKTNQNQLVKEEEELIAKKTTFFPIKVICPYHFEGNKNPCNDKVFKERRYPLTFGWERRKALAEHYFYKTEKTKNIFYKIWYLFLSLIHYPFNVPLKHYVKTNWIQDGK